MGDEFGMKQAILTLANFLDTEIGPASAADPKLETAVNVVGNPLSPGLNGGAIRRNREHYDKSTIGEYTDHFIVDLDLSTEGLDEDEAWANADELVRQVKVALAHNPKVVTPSQPQGSFLDTEVLGVSWFGARLDQGGFLGIATMSIDLQKIRLNCITN